VWARVLELDPFRKTEPMKQKLTDGVSRLRCWVQSWFSKDVFAGSWPCAANAKRLMEGITLFRGGQSVVVTTVVPWDRSG
jgi:hypothetical protein